MIRRVRLKAWKAFSELDLPLEAGTSFIVAHNGVGKSSLLQALHFGLFGDLRLLGSGTAVEKAVRGGPSATATVTLDVMLGDREWQVERSVPGQRGAREVLPPARVVVDGMDVDPHAWDEALESASGVSLSELRLLSAIGEGETVQLRADASDRYDIVRHLSHVLGVSRLRATAHTLEALAKRVSTDADRERLTLRDRPARRAEAEQTQLLQERAAETAQLARVQNDLATVRARQDAKRAWENWHQLDAQSRETARGRTELFATAIAEASPLLPAPLSSRLTTTPPSHAEEGHADEYSVATAELRRLTSLLSELRELRESLIAEVGAQRARIEMSDTALALLTQTGPVCPTCRQPLTPEAAAEGRADHSRLRREATTTLESTQAIIEDVGNAEVILRRTEEWLPSPPSPPPIPPVDDAAKDIDEQVERLRKQEARSDGIVRDLDAQIRALERDAAARAADAELSERLVTSYRQADLAAMAADAMTQTANQICTDRIAPLAEALEKRWPDLWPGRPRLRLDVTSGELSGEVGESRIDIADLSGGERAVATVLMRLLALQTASASPILLLDEPLEHLDPRNRRMLASLLVAATRQSAIPRQLLVTTYEESVTRRLDGAVDETSTSHVVYVATEPAPAP